MLTNTWLQEVGHQPYVKETSFPGYIVHSFPSVVRMYGWWYFEVSDTQGQILFHARYTAFLKLS